MSHSQAWVQRRALRRIKRRLTSGRTGSTHRRLPQYDWQRRGSETCPCDYCTTMKGLGA